MEIQSNKRFLLFKYLLSIDRLGPTRIINLLSKFDSKEQLLDATLTDLLRVESISEILAKKIISNKFNYKNIEESVKHELDQLQNKNIGITCFGDDDYPPLLKRIYYPPLILYYYGNLSIAKNNSVAIVGTRLPTDYGRAQSEIIAKDLVALGISIVSGLARGIDTVAHKSALKFGGTTIAVIGSGLDVIYPSENKKLFDAIKESGLIVSEFVLGTKPDAQNFPQRNRIISGISLGTLVIETKLTGGAMQTAAYALDQNREVFALPGNINVPQSEGTNALIQRGEAKLITNAEDILTELNLKIKPEVGKNIPKPKIDLNLFEQKILDLLSYEPKHIDNISDESSLSSGDCLVNLLSLEFKGMVIQLPGKNFKLSY